MGSAVRVNSNLWNARLRQHSPDTTKKRLTEVYPGDKIGGNPSYSGRIDGHADVIMAKCGSSRDFLNREIKSQVWNASVNLGTGGSGGGVIYGGGSSTTLEPSSTKGYVTSKELNPSTIAW